jgi:hypothetical protein
MMVRFGGQQVITKMLVYLLYFAHPTNDIDDRFSIFLIMFAHN